MVYAHLGKRNIYRDERLYFEQLKNIEMRNVLALFVFITTSTICYGQFLSEKILIGKWSVTKVTSPLDKMGLPESSMEEVITMKKAFHNSIFEFKDNGQFFITFENEPSIATDFEVLNGKNWKINSEDEQISIVDYDKGGEQVMFFPVPDIQKSYARMNILGVILLHMKKGVFSTEMDYENIAPAHMPNELKEKSIEEKRKDQQGEALYELGKANEAREAITYEDIKIIDGIVYLKDSNTLVKSRKIEERYEDGNLKMEGWFLDGKEDGVWTWYYENGQVSQEKFFIEGKIDGLSKEWDENGQITRKVNYKDGVKVNN